MDMQAFQEEIWTWPSHDVDTHRCIDNSCCLPRRLKTSKCLRQTMNELARNSKLIKLGILPTGPDLQLNNQNKNRVASHVLDSCLIGAFGCWLHKPAAKLVSASRPADVVIESCLSIVSCMAEMAPSQDYLLVASRSCCARACIACSPASGVGASPRTLTRALPTITPSAPQETTCCACKRPQSSVLTV